MNRTHLVPAVAGSISAASAFFVSLSVVAVPVLGAHAFDGRTHASTFDALIVAISILVLGHGGAITLGGLGIDGMVTLPPIGLSLLFIAIGTIWMRRLGGKLGVVGSDSSLRPGALRVLGTVAGSYSFTYAALCTIVAMVGASASIRPVALSAFVSACAIAAASAIAGLAWALSDTVPRHHGGSRTVSGVLALVPVPVAAALRALGATLMVMVAGAALVLNVQLILRRDAVAHIWAQLDAGWFGGIVLVLGQLAFLPTMIVWTLAFICGGNIFVGLGTGISFEGAAVGVMPTLPVLGALPEPGAFSPWLRVLMAFPVLAVIAGSVLLARATREFEPRDRLTAWIIYPVGLIAIVTVLAAFSGGAIGGAQLSRVGPAVLSLAPLLAIVAIPVVLIAGWSQTGLDAWAIAQVRALRTKVERAECVDATRKTDSDASESASVGGQPNDLDAGEGTVTSPVQVPRGITHAGEAGKTEIPSTGSSSSDAENGAANA